MNLTTWKHGTGPRPSLAVISLACTPLKKNALNDTRWIFILSDGTRISTPNLPLLSKKELDRHYGDSLQVLFNEPK